MFKANWNFIQFLWRVDVIESCCLFFQINWVSSTSNKLMKKYLPPILTFYSGFLQEILYIYDLLLCARNMIQSVTTTWHHKHFTALCFKKFPAANSSPANNNTYTELQKASQCLRQCLWLIHTYFLVIFNYTKKCINSIQDSHCCHCFVITALFIWSSLDHLVKRHCLHVIKQTNP